MDKKIICPACGSNDFKVLTQENIIEDTFSSETIIVDKYECNICGADGDFAGANEPILKETVDLVKIKSVRNIIDFFHDNNISMSAIERAFELPQRTLTKWRSKKTKPSASGVALMKIVRTYPWIIDVAQRKFERNYANEQLVRQGAHIFYSGYFNCVPPITNNTQIQMYTNVVNIINNSNINNSNVEIL